MKNGFTLLLFLMFWTSSGFAQNPIHPNYNWSKNSKLGNDQSGSISSGIVKKDVSSKKYCSSVGPGGICYMPQQKAGNYCATQGKHLPSIRELAQLTTSFGAKGILEVKEYYQKKAAGENIDEYHLIVAQNGSEIDRFYFSDSGYKRPAGPLGDNWFWSSSVYPVDANFDSNTNLPYLFYGDGNSTYFEKNIGVIDTSYHYNTHRVGVRCSAGNFKQVPVIPNSDERVSVSTGVVFIRDTSYPELDEAYRDPSGLVWGSTVKENGKVKRTWQGDALQYCLGIGARLPRRDEYEQLAKYLGGGTPQGFSTLAVDSNEVLPNLSYKFWSSTDYNGNGFYYDVFYGTKDGFVGWVQHSEYADFDKRHGSILPTTFTVTFRCVK